MSWFARKSKATQESYLQAGTAVVGHLMKRLGLAQTYTQDESIAISQFLSDFVAWGKRQLPPLFTTNADGQICCIPGLPASDLQGYATSIALQKLYRSDAYIPKGARKKLATALRAWVSFMDSGVLHDTIPMLKELGWNDEADRVSQVLHDFPPHHSNDRFLSECRSLLALENDPPPLM
jgi:hypothetical protein